jgi:hypothetical protein
VVKVEPSGVVFVDECSIQTARCMARERGAVTAVWGPPGQSQINVCGACIDEMMRAGAWEIEGARVRMGLPPVAGALRQD